MGSNDKYGRLIKRFLMSYIETHSAVLGDIVAVYITFSGELFVMDLVIYQVTRKLNATGIRDALISFAVQDQGLLHMMGLKG